MTSWRKFKNTLQAKEWLENKYIIEQLSIPEIAQLVGCNKHSVYKALRRSHIPLRPRVWGNNFGKPWERHELDFLKRNFRHLSYPEIAKELKRTPLAVARKATLLKLPRHGTTPPQPLGDMDAAYIAGFLDGDGGLSIGVTWKGDAPHQITPMLSFTNNHRPTLKWITSYLKPTGFGHLHVRKKHPGWKPVFQLMIADRDNLQYLLPKLLPYLKVKQEQAMIVLKFLALKLPYQTITEETARLAIQLKEANASPRKFHQQKLERLKKWFEQTYGAP